MSGPASPRCSSLRGVPARTLRGECSRKLSEELLDPALSPGLEEAHRVIDRRRLDYDHRRIHSSLDYETAAEYVADSLTLILLAGS
jgi:transposase InsO family protein